MRLRTARAGSLIWLAVLAAQPARADTIRITVEKLTFNPARVTAHVGDTVEWVNTDFIVHTATGRHKEWDVTIPAKGVGRVMLNSAGEIEYYCRFHPNMTGHLSVVE